MDFENSSVITTGAEGIGAERVSSMRRVVSIVADDSPALAAQLEYTAAVGRAADRVRDRGEVVACGCSAMGAGT
jgi:hypothetical protein